MARDAAQFKEQQQLASIDAVIQAAPHTDCLLHFITTDATHVHVLASWRGGRSWQQNRTSLKRSITMRLKSDFGRRPWLVDGSSRRRVKDREHFDYLMTKYLPSHRGWKWSEERGLFK